MLSPYCILHLIWFNNKLCRTLKYNSASWAQNGVQNVIDMFDNKGDLYTFADVKFKLNVKDTFLEYNRLVQNIPKNIRQKYG